jgi:hypothetical protein
LRFGGRDRRRVRIEDVAADVLDHAFGNVGLAHADVAKPLMLLSLAGDGQIDPNSVSEAAWSGRTHFVLAPPTAASSLPRAPATFPPAAMIGLPRSLQLAPVGARISSLRQRSIAFSAVVASLVVFF